MNLIKASSNNKLGKITFYIFEITAAVYFLVQFVLAIVDATKWQSFELFITTFLSAVVTTLILYGIGRIIDFISIRCVENKDQQK